MRELLDEVVDTSMEWEISAYIEQYHPAVQHVNKCSVRKSGFDRLIELHLIVDGEMSVRAWHLIAHQVEDGTKKHFANVQSVVVHIEPSYEVVG